VGGFAGDTPGSAAHARSGGAAAGPPPPLRRKRHRCTGLGFVVRDQVGIRGGGRFLHWPRTLAARREFKFSRILSRLSQIGPTNLSAHPPAFARLLPLRLE